MSYTQDLLNLAMEANGIVAGITTHATGISYISVGNSTVNSIVNSTGIYVDGYDVSNGTVAVARLGSGTANSTTILYGNGVFAAAPDSTNASALTSGTVAPARLGSGTANSTTILYGNGVFVAPPAGVNTAFQYTFTNTISFSSNVILVSGTVLTVGNSSVNTVINATSFSTIQSQIDSKASTGKAIAMAIVFGG